jgi:hypothetical protein
LVVLSLIADVTWSVMSASHHVRTARDALERAARELEAGDPASARSSFREAAASASAAASAAGHPGVRLAGALPGLGDDLEAVRSLTRATEIAAGAGEALAVAAETAGWDGTSVPGSSPGHIDLSVIEATTPALEDAARLLRRAEDLVSDLDPAGKLDAVGDAIRQARSAIGDRARQAQRAALLTRLLPGLLGGDGPRTYAIVMMTLSDPRGSGGYPGSYGVLRVVDGRFTLEELAPTSDLGRVPPVDAPKDVARRYARFGGLSHFISSTYSPDWPTSAETWMGMWAASGREPLDGVIGADSVWMSYLLEAMGSVQTPAWPEALTAANVSRIVDADTMRTLDHERSNGWQAAIATALWQAMVTRPVEARGFATALSRATAERHLQLYSADPAEEAILDELGASGRLDVPANPLMVSWSGFSPSRTGYFARKAVAYRMVMNADGTADVTIEISLTNGAPAAPESILLGSSEDGYPIGTYVAAASVYLPAEARRIRSRVDDGRSLVELFEREFDRRVVLTVLMAAAEQTTTAEITFRMPVEPGGFELGILPQPELRPTEFMVTATLADGATITSTSAGTTSQGGTLTYEGTPTTPIVIWATTGSS